jgi:hypothetical protein
MVSPPVDPASRPADVVRLALASHVAGDWHRLVEVADPASVREWCTWFISTNARAPTPEEMAVDYPDIHREALVRLIEAHLAPARRRLVAELESHVAGVHTLEAPLPAEMLRRYFEAGDVVARYARLASAAYADAGLLLPESVRSGRDRPERHFEILREEEIGVDEVRVTFREAESGSGALDGAWRLRRRPGVSGGSWSASTSSACRAPLRG